MKMNSDYHLLEAGHKPAVWTSELKEDNNAGAHMNTCYFDKGTGTYTELEDHTVPGQRDISVDWNSVDAKLGASVSFNSKADQ